MTRAARYSVVERNGWSYVEGDPMPRDSGPWRYRWEAQEYADELNAAEPKPMTDIVERMTGAGNDLTTLSESYEGQRQCGWFLEFAAIMRDGRDEIERLRAENERLRALKTQASRELLNITKGCLDSAEAEVEQLRAENEALRAELATCRLGGMALPKP